MPDFVSVDLTNEEAQVLIFVLKNIAQVDRSERDLISTFHSVERTREAKNTLKKIYRAKNQRSNYLENTQPATRNITSSDAMELTRLRDENNKYAETESELKLLIDDITKSAKAGNVEHILSLLKVSKMEVS